MPWIRALQLILLGASGALVTLSFAPWNLWYLALPGLTLLAYTQFRPASARRHFNNSLVFALGLFGAGVSWIYVSIHTYGESAAPLAGLLTGLFVMFLALVAALPWLIWNRLFRLQALLPLTFAGLWVLAEALRGWLFTGFPWLFIGHAHVSSPVAGWLPVGGALAASFVMAWLAAALAQLGRGNLRIAAPGNLFAALIVGGLGYALQFVEWTTGMEERTAALVQPAIPLEDKWDPSLRDTNLQKLRDLAQPHWGVELMIWPEAALPVDFSGSGQLLRELHEQALDSGTSLLTGRLAYSPFEQRYYNTLVGLGLAGGEYSKRRLVPFGEYVPLEQHLRGLIRFFDMPMSTLSAGKQEQPLLHAAALDVAAAICYEIAYAWQTARDAADAQFILTISNDTWFGDSIGPWQHLQLAQVRAAENRKPVVRATNNGITALINERGELTRISPQFVPTVLTGTLQPRVGKTPFSRWGHLPILSFSAFILLICFTFKAAKPEPVIKLAAS